jgi:predicted enzyme involved in methoxymalonyl-ACP biosynthesis
MILKEDNFASIRINWNDKVANIKEIAEELNIGLDSIVFFDDDPINRDYVKSTLPQVLTVELSDSSSYSQSLKSMNDFQVLKITNEDTKRGKMYLDQRKRTTKRYQEEEIRKFVGEKKKIVECAQIQDKFGDNGITGVYIVNKENQHEWFVDSFLMSCRVMGRGVEEALLGQIIERAKMEGITEVKAQYIKTKKNKPAENFLSDFGFKRDGDIWIFETNKPIKKSEHLVIS